MPEHRNGTPPDLRDLESFLWWDFDAIDTWVAWVKARGFRESVARTTFADAGEVQHALRQLEISNSGLSAEPGAVVRLNSAIRYLALKPQILISGKIEIGRADPKNPVGHILQLVVGAMMSGAWTRFKLCRDPDCRASFFDASKNAAKTWCAMEKCGSRNKMRRFRARNA